MPEFRNVRSKDAISAFEVHGGIVRRGKGAHVNIKMPNDMILTFSNTREPVKIGLLKAMIRKAGLSEEEFSKSLGRVR